MHELSMAQAIVRTVVKAVPDRRVLVVTLRVGAGSGVVLDALRFVWDIAAQDTVLAGSRLEVVDVPITLRCRECGVTGEVPEALYVRCPGCHGLAVDLLGGRELEVATVEVEDPPIEQVSR